MKKILLLVPVIFFLTHCGSGAGTGSGSVGSASSVLLNLQISNPNPDASGTAKAVVMSPAELSQAKTVTRANLTTCTLTVTATGMTTLTQSFSVSSSASTITTSLSISPGASRTFAIDCSDGSATTNNITVGYEGSATADISETTSSVSISPQFKNLISHTSSVVNYVRLNQENSTQTQLTIGFGSALTAAQKAAMQVIVELDTSGTRTSLGSIDSSQTAGLKTTTAVPYIVVAGGTKQPLGFLYETNQAKKMKTSCAWTTNDSGNAEAVCTFGITQLKDLIDSSEQGQFAAIGSLTGASPWDELPSGAKYAKFDLSPNTNTTTDTLAVNGSACDTSRSGETCISGFCSDNSLCVTVPQSLNASVTNFVGPDPGTTTAGSTDGTGSAARFNLPKGLCISPEGAELYVTDGGNTIRRMVIATQVVSTFAGTAGASGTTDGTGTDARFRIPVGCVMDSSGTNMYVVDITAHTIRKIVPATRVVTTLAGVADTAGNVNSTTGTAAQFDAPAWIAINSLGNTLYVSEENNNDIRKININTTEVSLFAGSVAGTAGNVDGIGSAARFNTPESLAIDSTDTNLYIVDGGNSNVRKIVIATQEVSTIPVGLGGGLAIDPTDTYLYATTFEDGIHFILRFTINGGTSSVNVAGQNASGDTNGTGTSASFNNPLGVVFNSTGTTLYIADRDNNKIRQIQ